MYLSSNMVPKTNQSSSKSQGASSSSEDLYNKTHDFVLSRTPDQSQTSVYLQLSMRSAIAAISQEIGWNTTHLSAIDLLSDLTARYLVQIAKQTKKYAEHCGRTLVCDEDIVLGLRDMNVSVSELEEYVQNFDPIPTQTKETAYFPVPRKTDLNFLKHGSDERLTRPLHVHEYMPPMIFEQPEETEKDHEMGEANGDIEEQLSGAEEVRVSEPSDDVQSADDGEQSSAQMQSEVMTMPFVLEEPSQVPDVGSELVVTESQPLVITEEVEVKTENVFEPESDAVTPIDEPMEIEPIVPENEEKENAMEEESSDDEIEPGLKAATMFASFKSTKKLGARTENAAIKRIRKMLEEQGHPVREVSSVIMTKDGFLSESKQACLPECKPPPNRDFFDTSPVPVGEKKRKPPTMKKILEGVKKLEKGRDQPESGGEDEPGLFGVMDKIKITNPSGGIEGTVPELNAATVGLPVGENSKKKLSKQERKLLHQKRKEKKLKIKAKSKEKQLLKKAKLQAAVSDSKELDPSGSKNKLTIFTKKLKAAKLDLAGGSISKKKKKDKKNKSKPKELKLALGGRIDERNQELISQAPTNTEMIESDEDFSNIPEGRVVPPMHIMNPVIASVEDQVLSLPKKKIKKVGKLKPQMFDLALQKQPSKKFMKINKKGLPIPPMGLESLKTKLPKLKRPFEAIATGEEGSPAKKRRGRPPKKIWGELPGTPSIPGNNSVGVSPGGSMSLPAAQLADIGKSLMMKEPQLNVVKIRKEHMELADAVQRPPMFNTNPTTLSPSKGMMPSLVNADLLKRLPAQPGLIPDHLPVPPVRLPKELSSSISVTPSLSSPQKEHSAMASSSSPRNLASNMCSSVTITRIEMTPQKLPSRFDDAITPGIGPPPGMEGPIKRSKFGKPPPLLQIPVHTETESGITITPIVMGGGGGGGGGGGNAGSGGGVAVAHAGGGNKEHRYDHPLPPPPPLQERPQKHSMLAKLDEELSSTTSVTSSPSKDQRKKEKEKRKELRKEKKKKAKDKSKDKSEKKKKKKDKSGESTSATSDAGELPIPITVPKLTLKLGSHSTTTTPVDSPNPPQIYHEPPMPGPTPPPKKLTIKGLNQEQEPTPKPAKQPKMPSLTFAPPRQEEEDLQVARFAPLVTRPQKPARAAKAHAAAAVAAMGMGASVMSHQDIVQFPSMRDSGGNRTRGRGRPPKGNVPPVPPVSGIEKVATPSTSKQAKSSLTVLETETVGCIIDEQGNKIWICPACGRQDDGSPMIGCDICDDWYHFVCVGITKEPDEDDPWYCQRCKKKQKEGKPKKGRK